MRFALAAGSRDPDAGPLGSTAGVRAGFIRSRRSCPGARTAGAGATVDLVREVRATRLPGPGEGAPIASAQSAPGKASSGPARPPNSSTVSTRTSRSRMSPRLRCTSPRLRWTSVMALAEHSEAAENGSKRQAGEPLEQSKLVSADEVTGRSSRSRPGHDRRGRTDRPYLRVQLPDRPVELQAGDGSVLIHAYLHVSPRVHHRAPLGNGSPPAAISSFPGDWSDTASHPGRASVWYS